MYVDTYALHAATPYAQVWQSLTASQSQTVVAERLKFAEHICSAGLGNLEGTRWKSRERTQLLRNEAGLDRGPYDVHFT